MFVKNRVLMIVSLIVLGCMSCRTTSPRATLLRELTPPTGLTRDPVRLPAYQAPLGLKAQVFQWVVISKPDSAVGEGEFLWNLDLRSGMEIWCERRCSEFSLQSESVATQQGGVERLVAVKKVIQGNTTPGMLKVQKELRGKLANTKHVVIENIGVKGNSVVIDEVISGDRVNFYAVPMKISGAASSASLIGEFMNKKVIIKLSPGVELAIPAGAEPLSAFVMGTLNKASNESEGSTEVFTVSKIISPWSEH